MSCMNFCIDPNLGASGGLRRLHLGACPRLGPKPLGLKGRAVSRTKRDG